MSAACPMVRLPHPVVEAARLTATAPLPVLCPSPTVLPRRLATWTALGRPDPDAKKAWYKAHSQSPTRPLRSGVRTQCADQAACATMYCVAYRQRC